MRLQHGATSSIASVELHVQSLWDLGTCSKLASPAPVKLVLNLHTCEEAMKSKLRVERRKCRQSWSKSQMLLRRAAALRAVSPRSRRARLCRAQQRTRSGMVPACVVLTSFIAGVAELCIDLRKVDENTFRCHNWACNSCGGCTTTYCWCIMFEILWIRLRLSGQDDSQRDVDGNWQIDKLRDSAVVFCFFCPLHALGGYDCVTNDVWSRKVHRCGQTTDCTGSSWHGKHTALFFCIDLKRGVDIPFDLNLDVLKLWWCIIFL